MPYADLRELYANGDTIAIYKQVRLPDSGVLVLPRPLALSWAYQFGRVPSGNVSFMHEYGVASPAIYDIEKGNRIEFWVGLRTAAGEQFSQIVFTGRVDSTSRNNSEVVLECVGMSKILEKPFRGTLITLDGSLTANQAVTQLLELAGIQNYVVDLPNWTPGTCCPEPLELKDMTIGDAINRIAMVDGSGWYEMPSGQVRVDRRDPIPAETAERVYYSMIPGPGGGELAPAAVLTGSGRPRLLSAQSREYPQELRTRITIRGGTCVEDDGEGSVNNVDVEATASDPDSPFIPDCPGDSSEHGEDIPFDTIDCPDKAAEVASRYLDLYNRMVIRGNITVPLDPTLFTGLTCQIEDPAFSELTGNWFVDGYNCTLSPSDATSSISFVGGPESGSLTLLNPWADFQWKKNMEGPDPGEDGNQTNWDPDAPPPPGVGDDPAMSVSCTPLNEACDALAEYFQGGESPVSNRGPGIAVGWADPGFIVDKGGEVIATADIEYAPGSFTTRYLGAVHVGELELSPIGGLVMRVPEGLDGEAEASVIVLHYNSDPQSVTVSGGGGKPFAMIPINGGVSSLAPFPTDGTDCGNLKEFNGGGITEGALYGFGAANVEYSRHDFFDAGAVAVVTLALGQNCCKPINDAKEVVPDPELFPVDPEDPDPPDPEDPANQKLKVDFDASQSRDWDGTIVSYAWSDSISGAIGSGKHLTRYYDLDQGSVNVTLTVTDNDGLTATKTKTVALMFQADPPLISVDGGDQSAPECLTTAGEGGDNCTEPPAIADLFQAPTFICGDDED